MTLDRCPEPKPGFSASMRGQFETGKRRRFRKGDDWQCTCVNCGTSFTNRRALQKHMLVCENYEDIQILDSETDNASVNVETVNINNNPERTSPAGCYPVLLVENVAIQSSQNLTQQTEEQRVSFYSSEDFLNYSKENKGTEFIRIEAHTGTTSPNSVGSFGHSNVENVMEIGNDHARSEIKEDRSKIHEMHEKENEGLFEIEIVEIDAETDESAETFKAWRSGEIGTDIVNSLSVERVMESVRTKTDKLVRESFAKTQANEMKKQTVRKTEERPKAKRKLAAIANAKQTSGPKSTKLAKLDKSNRFLAEPPVVFGSIQSISNIEFYKHCMQPRLVRNESVNSEDGVDRTTSDNEKSESNQIWQFDTDSKEKENKEPQHDQDNCALLRKGLSPTTDYSRVTNNQEGTTRKPYRVTPGKTMFQKADVNVKKEKVKQHSPENDQELNHYSCKFCHLKFRHQSRLARHVHNDHQLSGDLNTTTAKSQSEKFVLMCSHCGLGCESSQELAFHTENCRSRRSPVDNQEKPSQFDDSRVMHNMRMKPTQTNAIDKRPKQKFGSSNSSDFTKSPELFEVRRRGQIKRFTPCMISNFPTKPQRVYEQMTSSGDSTPTPPKLHSAFPVQQQGVVEKEVVGTNNIGYKVSTPSYQASAHLQHSAFMKTRLTTPQDIELMRRVYLHPNAKAGSFMDMTPTMTSSMTYSRPYAKEHNSEVLDLSVKRTSPTQRQIDTYDNGVNTVLDLSVKAMK